ncbi:hypothetical protein PGIGA_G00213400 [Pangasianodon gigas]|uniref:Uncharacterized protein n=1 Tax=Pangasianodon gigas TaxID=30993 RepID=A0ACC5WGQ6_PANGG|nr:hypothetical protein [Pangasianodon gigas]
MYTLSPCKETSTYQKGHLDDLPPLLVNLGRFFMLFLECIFQTANIRCECEPDCSVVLQGLLVVSMV